MRSEAFYQLIGFVRGPLGFGDVLLLVDGLDGFPYTEGDPAAIVRWLEFLLEQAEGWRSRRMFLKLFLPDSVGEFLDRASPASLKLDVFTLHWTARKLAEMLQQRLRTATNSRIDSMNAFAAPHLPDAEEYVARQVRPYPRDTLVFVRRLLYQLMQRGRDEDLQAEDFATALAWYRTQSGLVSPTPTSSIRSNGDGVIAPY